MMHVATDEEAATLEYDALIATCNRPEALKLSLPLLVGQTRPPQRIILVDASDDHDSIIEAVRSAVGPWRGELTVLRSDRSLPRQRNLGLAHVRSQIVVCIDDDSLLYPDAAQSMLAVYEMDTNREIAAVCASEAMVPPDSTEPAMAYSMSRGHQIEARIRRIRNHLERRLPFLKPAMRLGRELNARHAVPDWLDEGDANPVEYMTGFRMSFRIEAIRREGFDEALSGYALDEDIDASFTAARSGIVVGAQRARIFHHRCPSGRVDAFGRGEMEILNRAYVLLKHASGAAGSPALTLAVWRLQTAFVALKILTLLPGVFSQVGRKRLAGAWSGYRRAAKLWSAVPGARPGIVRTECRPPRAEQTLDDLREAA